MPRRRPPGGAGHGLSTTLIAILLVLPWISTAAQQQQPPQNAQGRSPREEARINTNIPPKHAKASYGRLEHAAKHRPYTPVLAQNARAVATTVPSAPAGSAVGAPLSRNAASSDGLTRPSARSLQDWEVEDFVLLATVDGHIHARDRYNGDEIWELDINKPMLETIYNTKNDSEGDFNNVENKPFIWIVEPTEDGALYILTPGPRPLLQSLGMTVKQLTEDLSPYSSDDPPVVYTAEKRNFMLVVDARTGKVTKSFSPSGSMSIDSDESCVPHSTGYFQTKERECKGVFNLGQTEYTISIHNRLNGEHMCTIKYSEWTPNNRDRDLQAQYEETMDAQYIYSRFDGHAIAYDHKRSKPTKRPVFERKLPYPVARVFDVARTRDDEDPEPALVLLPQPPGPSIVADKGKHVWLNTTDTGSWYALSEVHYPAVTDSAPQAPCYELNDLLAWDGPHYLPDRRGLVGVHLLDYRMEPPSHVRQIDAPTYSNNVDDVVPIPPTLHPREPLDSPPETVIESRPHAHWWILVFTLLLVATCTGVTYARPPQLDAALKFVSRWAHQRRVGEPQPMVADTLQPNPQPVEEEPPEVPVAEVQAAEDLVEKVQEVQPVVQEPKEKKVTFDIPDDEDDDLSPLSRTTTAEQASPVEEGDVDHMSSNEMTQPLNGIDGAQDQSVPITAPAKKKKTHRGKRGGQKGKNKKPKDGDELDQIVDAAKQLNQTPTLHPDEITVNGDDMQDVSNTKRIGKLTIDFDKVLGNGSGGTFVFMGKWNERDVAVKRMLPQYFGLAEQEVKLLQESDLHPNVIRYFDDEKDENFLYIAVELCQASLWDLYRDGRPCDDVTDAQLRLMKEINGDAPKALHQLAEGVNHLHSLRIIHRDIKPQNILIAYPQRNAKKGPRLVISDFGLCKTLPDNMSTLIGTTGNAGTVGWKAPELILQPKDVERGSSTGHSRDSSSSTDPVTQGVKRAVDIFSLGCVFFYVLTNGSHPFDDDEGWMQIRELNIKKNKPNLKQLDLGDSEEPIHLIKWMLSNQPENRPTAKQVMNHPFFWSKQKRLDFLCDCSDHWEHEPRDPPSDHLLILEKCSEKVLDEKRNFLNKLDRGFIASLGKQRKYTGDRMLDLLRALRNKKNHYEDMDEFTKAKVGPIPDGYLAYWTTKFPQLLMSCYECVKACGLQEEPRFRAYFDDERT